MIRRLLWAQLLFGLVLQIPAVGQQKPASSAPAEQTAKEDPLSRFHWLADSSDTRGIGFETGKLSPVKIDPRQDTSAEIETEIVRPTAGSMRITRHVYDRGAGGERQLVEVVVEDVRVTPGDGLSATRTVSRRDINGRMMLARKETQETVPVGTGAYRTQATTMLERGSGSLVRAEEVVQVEKKKGEGTFEFERSRRTTDVNGGWVTAEQRVGSARMANGETVSQEDFYRQDVNGKLSLDRREVSREWQDTQGTTHKDSDIYRVDSSGGIQLNERMNIMRTSASDGSVQTTQSLYQKSAVSPSEGLKLVQRIVEASRPSDSKTTEKDTEVQVPDGNGRLQTVGQVRVYEKK